MIISRMYLIYFKIIEAQCPKKAGLAVPLWSGFKIYKTQFKRLGKTILSLLLLCVKALLLAKPPHYFVLVLLQSGGQAYFAGQEYE